MVDGRIRMMTSDSWRFDCFRVSTIDSSWHLLFEPLPPFYLHYNCLESAMSRALIPIVERCGLKPVSPGFDIKTDNKPPKLIKVDSPKALEQFFVCEVFRFKNWGGGINLLNLDQFMQHPSWYSGYTEGASEPSVT